MVPVDNRKINSNPYLFRCDKKYLRDNHLPSVGRLPYSERAEWRGGGGGRGVGGGGGVERNLPETTLI